MPGPVIGLSVYREHARWGVWDTTADLLPTVYARAVEEAGGLPVLLPPLPTREAAAGVVARLDGLVISGGADVSPERYGEQPHARTANWRDDRDAWELALLTAADASGLPVLGVCRGMQVMAVAAGGALEQHVPDRLGRDDHSPGGDVFGSIDVSVVQGSQLSTLVPPEMTVHCHHHQAVAVHPGYSAVAWAADGTLEAIESAGPRMCLGVQWHPEMAADAGLFAALVAAAASYAEAR